MFIKLVIWGILIYSSLKVIRFFKAISASAVSKMREPVQPHKSYNEKDVIDVEYKEIKDAKKND